MKMAVIFSNPQALLASSLEMIEKNMDGVGGNEAEMHQ